PPVGDAGAGAAAAATRSRHWREDKVGCLLSMAGAAPGDEPCPEIPAVFVTPGRALLLAQGVGQCAVPGGAAPPGGPAGPAEPRAGRPRSCCARLRPAARTSRASARTWPAPPGPGLLRRGAAGVRGRRRGGQLDGLAALVPALRADHRLLARAELRV